MVVNIDLFNKGQGGQTRPPRLFWCCRQEAATSGPTVFPNARATELDFMILVCPTAGDKSQVVLSAGNGGCTGEIDYKI